MWVSLTVNAVRDADGQVVESRSMVVDITKRKRAEEALRRYAERLQVLHKIDQAILAAWSVEEIIEAALYHLRRLVPCLRASVVMFDLEANEMSLIAVQVDGKTRLGKGEHISLEGATCLWRRVNDDRSSAHPGSG